MTTSRGAAPTRIRRSRSDRVIAGVAGGLAHHLGVPSILLRIAFVALFFTGSGVLLYVLAWIVMPCCEEENDVNRSAESREAVRLLAGGLLAALGVVILLNQIIPWFGRVLWPAILIMVGTAVVVYVARS